MQSCSQRPYRLRSPCSRAFALIRTTARGMRVELVPVLSDNYAYLLISASGEAAAVDPVEPSKVLAAAQKAGVDVKMVLTTHHHW